MYDWNDLRYFLELSRQGKLVRAAARLHVDHTTVSRRITALEKQLDVRLFDKSPNGYQLTDAGLRLLPLAEQIETRSNQLYQDIAGKDAPWWHGSRGCTRSAGITGNCPACDVFLPGASRY